jgi:hypothetical protein
MILTQCAVCATELGLTLGKKCGRCSTRYCGAECQKKHWEEGGHDKICKRIKKAGGAEQYNANEKYAEAVSVAAEACAEDTKGQTCYICTQALHWKTKEGLVRMCACRGTAGFAHVSCLAEQAKILREEAEYNNLDDEALDSRWARWYSCSLCEQKYYGVVRCALGWACWKTYLGRPEGNDARLGAIRQLGNGLFDAYHHEDALSVQEAELSMHRRLGFSEDNILVVQGNLANAYSALERFEQALLLQRDVYLGTLKHRGNQHEETFRAANNYSNALLDLKRFKETKALLRKMIPVVRRVLGESHEITLQMRWNYGEALRRDSGSTLDDVREAVTSLEDAERTARRVLGGAHPNTCLMAESLENARALLRAYEPSPPPTTSY